MSDINITKLTDTPKGSSISLNIQNMVESVRLPNNFKIPTNEYLL